MSASIRSYRGFRSAKLFLVSLLFATSVAPALAAGTATTTTLTITVSGAEVAKVNSGTAVTFSAKVVAGANSVTAGTVYFCDATAPICSDIHRLGSALLGSGGTAQVVVVVPPGVHSYKALFTGTATYNLSASPATGLTVSDATTTTITQSGSAGSYSLKATVTGKGLVARPTGTVSFVDTSASNKVLSSVDLTAGSAGSVVWTTTQSPATEPLLQFVAVGDFNGDGIPDLAVATSAVAGSKAPGYLSILLGNGNGTFQTAKTVSTGIVGSSIAVGHFVKGGPLDVIIVSTPPTSATSTTTANNAQVFLGDGKGGGTLGTPFNLGGVGSATSVAVADLNRDGKDDIVFSGITFGVYVVVPTLGNGDGTFGNGTLNAVGSNPVPLTPGVFGANGYVDVVIADSGLNQVTIFENDGEGDFFPAGQANSGTTPIALVTGDFNGDGYADVAVLNSGSDNVTILLGHGNYTLTASSQSPVTGSKPTSIAVGDFNHDGIADLAIANSGDDTVTILTGNGDGTFKTNTPLSTGVTPRSLGVGSFNGTGMDAIAVANENAADMSASTVTVLSSTLTQTATATATGVNPTGSGTHLVDASYPGDTNYAASVSATTSLTGTGGTGLTITPATVTFPSTTVGTSAASQLITLKNSTSAAVSFTASTTITGTGAASFSKTASTCTNPLPAGSSCTNTIVFTPTATGTLTATVTYTDSASSTPQTVALSGTGASASTGLTITPATVTFPSTTVGTSAASQLITLKNSTSAAVSFTASTTITGTGAASFSKTASTCTNPLAAGASCTNTIVFTPTATGALTATVTYTDSASSTPQTVALSGTGASASTGLTITPATVTFPSTTVGTSAASQLITLKNSTSAAVSFTASTTITGSGSASFSKTASTCTNPLPAGASCTNTIVFTPATTGVLTATVTYTDSATSTPQTVALSGTGASASAGLTITPSALTFSSTTVGTSAASQLITLKNSTSAAVSFTASTTITGSGASSFSKTASTCTNPLAAGASCTNTIVFTPTTTGALTATVTYTDSASSTPQTVVLSGTGASASAGLTITPSSLTFSSTTVGTSAASQLITLKNSTSAAVSFTASTTITGSGAASFSKTASTCTNPLASGASCTNTIVFTPTTTGALTATVTYTDSASSTPQTVGLSGTGASASGAGVTATPMAVSFPFTAINKPSQSQVVTFKNTSTATITSLAITLTGTGTGSYAKTQTCGTTLAAGASCTVSITFTPVTDGTITGTLQLTGSGSTSLAVSLSGICGDPTEIAPDANTYVFNTTEGNIYVELRPDVAPKNVANFLYYVGNGTYTSSIIHRVVAGFINQGGGYKLNSEGQIVAPTTTAAVVNEFKLSNVRGTLAMAKISNDPNSATDQFFFNTADNSSTLDTQDGGSTVIGSIVGVQGVNIGSASQGLAVMDAMNAVPVFAFQAPFDSIPLVNYTQGAAVEPANYVYVNSISQYTAKNDGPATPIFSPSGGSYTGPTTVTLTDATPNSTIYYYLFGGSSQITVQYTGPFTIPASQYVVAYATAPGNSSQSYYNYEYYDIVSSDGAKSPVAKR